MTSILKQVFLFCCLSGLFFLTAKAQAPVPDFTANVVSGCGPLGVTFKDLTTGNPTHWTWDFGNGQISSLQNPSTTYGTPGVYTVTLVVRGPGGTNAIKKTDYITVYPFPSVSFTSSPSTLSCAPANVQFLDRSTPGAGSISGWNWTFGDGQTSTAQNPGHLYTQPGYYTVGLKVTNSQNCSNAATITRFIRVIDGIQANFSWSQTSTSCSAPYSLNFINQTAGPGNLSYAWSFSNGGASNQANPSVTFPSAPNYTATLIAKSDLGCSQTIQQNIIFPGGNAVISGPDSACVNTPVSFLNASAPAPLSSSWTFGDGNSSVATNPSNTYGAVNVYPVKLVNTYGSCTDSVVKNIKIVSTPVFDFSADKTASCQAPFTVNFTGPAATGWLWDFGDGTATSSQQNPSHTYTTTGSFNVTLTISTSAGCPGTVLKSSFIMVEPPTISLLYLPVQGCTNSPVKPTSSINTVDGIKSYAWTAPGATPSSSSAGSPLFTYTAQGNYDLGLTVTTIGGCVVSNTFPNAVLIGTPTAPAFTVAPSDTTCGRDPFKFKSIATPADHWAWNFGDGTVTQYFFDSTRHSYSDTGSFTVTLTISNHGCFQSTTAATSLKVFVNPPIPDFKYKIADCLNRQLVNFIDSSKVDPAKTPISYTWDFGDGSPVVVVSSAPYSPPSHLFPALQLYNVTLTITNGSCTNSFTKPVDLRPQTVAITPPGNPPSFRVCKNDSFTLAANVSNPSLITKYQWMIGSGINIQDSTPKHKFILTDTGAYALSLVVTYIDGCSDASTPPGTVLNVTGPAAKFTPAGIAGGCRNSSVIFTDQSTPYRTDAISNWTWDFGDGNTVAYPPALGPPFTHVYADTGSFSVKLTVQDGNGCIDTFRSPTPVQITAPRAGFYVKDTLPFFCPGKPLPFVDTSKGYIVSYDWNFGDGNFGTGPTPTNSFPAATGQKYTIKLKVTDKVGCSDSVTRPDYVIIQSPIAAFTIADTTGICIPLQTIFTPQGQFYDSLYWDFGDGTTSTLPNTVHFYDTYNTFNAKLVLRGPGGCLDSAARRVFLVNPYTATTLQYGPPLKQCDSLLVNFTIIPPGYTRFTIYFGDGKVDSSGNLNPSDYYKSPSTYSPYLQLQDSSGCIVNISGANAITVLGAIPFFSIDKHAFCDSGTVNFTDFTITNDAPISETWLFGDGQSSTQPNPTHLYNSPGNHLATLQVTTNSNCLETYTDTVKIFPTPHPVITLSNPFCVNSPIQFQGSLVNSGVDSVIWAWNFGNGQNSAQQSPLETYAQAGVFVVNLKTSVPFGCQDTTSKTIVINPLPTVKGPPVITTPVGFPVTIPFTYSSGIVSFSWTPAANLSCTDCSNPVASPTFSTLYQVTITDSNSCVASGSIQVKTICDGKNYFLPNTFSPNGDGVNDVFYPRGSNLYNIQSMRIFNRWGQMIFERRNFPANSQTQGWDGTINGRPASPDVYIYIVEVICNNAQIVALKGDVTLIR